MPIDYAKLKGLVFSDIEHRFSSHDAILDALGIGCGHDPTEAPGRRTLCRESPQAPPALAVVIGAAASRRQCPLTGVDWSRSMHSEQGLVLHRPLPAAGTMIARARVTEILDEGDGRDALLYAERVIHDGTGGARLCTLTSTMVLREQGGFGGPRYRPPPPLPLPDRAPDLRLDLPAPPASPLSDRAFANCDTRSARPPAAACFQQLALPELTTYAVAGRAVLRTCCDDEPTRLESLHARFTAPVFPGETISTEIWRDGPRICFRCRVTDRNSLVLDNGLAVVAD